MMLFVSLSMILFLMEAYLIKDGSTFEQDYSTRKKVVNPISIIIIVIACSSVVKTGPLLIPILIILAFITATLYTLTFGIYCIQKIDDMAEAKRVESKRFLSIFFPCVTMAIAISSLYMFGKL